MDKEAFKSRTKAFALRTIRLVEALPEKPISSQVIGKQLIRSGTSVGANYRAACRAKSTAELITKLNITLEEADDKFNQIYSLITTYGGYEQLLEEYQAVNAYKGNNYLPFIWRFYKSHRSAFFRLIHTWELQSTSTDNSLIDAIQFLIKNRHKKGQYLSAEVDLSFASPQWQNFVIYQNELGTKLFRRHFEVCVFSYLAFELKSGDICLKD